MLGLGLNDSGFEPAEETLCNGSGASCLHLQDSFAKQSNSMHRPSVYDPGIHPLLAQGLTKRTSPKLHYEIGTFLVHMHVCVLQVCMYACKYKTS